jgi:hypothetical protein
MVLRASRHAVRHVTAAFAIMLAFAFVGSLAGFVLGRIRRPNPDFSNSDPYLVSLDIQNPAAFVPVAYIHNASYIGGLLGLTLGITWIIRKRAAHRRAAFPLPDAHELIISENEKTRFAVWPNGSSRCGGETAKRELKAFFESFSSHEFDSLRSLDFDFLTGLRVHTRASFASRDLESAEPNKLNRLRLFDTRLDRIDHRIHRALCFSFAGFLAEGFLDGFDEFDFVHIGKLGCFECWRH